MVVLRPLEPEDCDVLLPWITSADALFQWSGPWDFRWPLDREQLLHDLGSASARRLLFAAADEAGSELLGHAMLTVQPEHGLGVIGRVLVNPGRRGGACAGFIAAQATRYFEQPGSFARVVALAVDRSRLIRTPAGLPPSYGATPTSAETAAVRKRRGLTTINSSICACVTPSSRRAGSTWFEISR